MVTTLQRILRIVLWDIIRDDYYNLKDVPVFSRGDTASFFNIYLNMEKIFILIETTKNGFNVKPYASFNRLCKDNNINKDMVSKDHLPFKVGDKTILEAEVNIKL